MLTACAAPRVRQRGPDVRQCELRILGTTSSVVSPGVISPTIVATGMRVPAMHGIRPMIR